MVNCHKNQVFVYWDNMQVPGSDVIMSLSPFWSVFLDLMGVACNLRFNVRVLEGSGKKVDMRYKKDIPPSIASGFIAKVWKKRDIEVFSDVT